MNSEKLVFKTKIDKTFFAIHFGILAVLLFFTIEAYYSTNDSSTFSMMLGFCMVAFLFTITSFLFLKIILKDDFLIVHHFFNLYKIDIKTITTIQIGKTMWVGFHKHGTAINGLIISSKFKNDVYITPKDEEIFLQKLMAINPDIIIKKD